MAQPEPMTIDAQARKTLRELHASLETALERDVVAITGPILPGLEHRVRDAIEATDDRRERLAVVLQTPGGVVEVAERMVNVFRHYYSDVAFIIPDVAMSAGTVLAMSGDEIMMDFFSCLGPIDPQIPREGKLVPALSYLVQFKRLMDKAAAGTATTADFALLGKFDLAELHQYEMARELSTTLLVKWLAKYKFKDWTVTEGQKRAVTQEMREARAEEIARRLSDHEYWRSHGRRIPMQVLQDELKLRIQDFGSVPEHNRAIRDYFHLMSDFIAANSWGNFVHAKNYI
ncbi:serine dehydrogenasease [Pyxidicoccus fallax]|uniref:Serine dehydrogenasease n=1 Tax=Pyxidicoccus fallax TaxID=394095 RepID=A0A848L9N5_9BACT|nr:serine dehydrogenasease [Pyxidicoccus fallax]NMO15246.1 serine dehydrogenasease [Pyxidicoccus fallax]NPC76982.1 serine dehydrogenasease [Pyxidicoccus fallax]